jgi:hypothetical protein
VASNLAVDRGVDEDFYGCGCPLLMEGRVDDARVGAQEARNWGWGIEDGPGAMDRWSYWTDHGQGGEPMI